MGGERRAAPPFARPGCTAIRATGLHRHSRDRAHWTMVDAEREGLAERKGFSQKGGIVWAATPAGASWLAAREAADGARKAS